MYVSFQTSLFWLLVLTAYQTNPVKSKIPLLEEPTENSNQLGKNRFFRFFRNEKRQKRRERERVTAAVRITPWRSRP